MAGVAFLIALPGVAASSPFDKAEGTFSNTFYLGNMTNNKFEDILRLDIDFRENYLVGYALAYDRPISARWSIGAEVQFTYHFGKQGYGEIGVPLTVRYRPENPWIAAFESGAFGLGMSHATELPQVELSRGDDARRNLFYWLLEAEFRTRDPKRSWFVRIHHRSNAWGTLPPEDVGGSNALAIGIRQDF